MRNCSCITTNKFCITISESSIKFIDMKSIKVIIILASLSSGSAVITNCKISEFISALYSSTARSKVLSSSPGWITKLFKFAFFEVVLAGIYNNFWWIKMSDINYIVITIFNFICLKFNFCSCWLFCIKS